VGVEARAAARADAAQAPGTESRAGGVTDAWLVARGLIGRGMIGEQSARDVGRMLFAEESGESNNRSFT
jgi:hypothetical protein